MKNVQPSKDPLLVSKVEAAALLGVCLRSIDLYISSKELPCRHFGKRILIPYSTLLSFSKRDHPVVRQGGATTATAIGTEHAQ